MKGWGYYCLGTFVVTFLASLTTFFVTRYPTDVGEVVAAVLLVFVAIGCIAALMSKFVGFGHWSIPAEQRGIAAGFRAMSLPMGLVLLVGISYAIAILTTSKYNAVAKILNTYYLEVTPQIGDENIRIYYSQSGKPTKRQKISEEEAFGYMWQWVRIYTAAAVGLEACAVAFFFSRAARQSPELKKQLAEGMMSAQVDDSMNL